MTSQSTTVAVPTENGGEWEWQAFGCESHADKVRKYLKNERFNDVTILCNDGKQVSCQSFMLRVNSDVFDEMLGGDDFDVKVGTIEAPKFSSLTIERVKYYCYLGEIPNVGKVVTRICQHELHITLNTLLAADYYNIEALGCKCLDRVKLLIDKMHNAAFMVAGMFGLNYTEEPRKLVASAMLYARNRISEFKSKRLGHRSIVFVKTIQSPDTIRRVFDLIPMGSDSLLKFKFLEKCVDLSLNTENAETVAKALILETKLLENIGSLCPRHLVDSNGVIRASKLVTSADIMEAIYTVPLSEWRS